MTLRRWTEMVVVMVVVKGRAASPPPLPSPSPSLRPPLPVVVGGRVAR